MRQLTSTSGAVTYAKAYDPYGTVTSTAGASQTAYGYTGEFTSNDLVYLRARHYAPGMGRFLTRDTWMGEYNSPMSLNRWMYVTGNPINVTDPSGYKPCTDAAYNVDLTGTWPDLASSAVCDAVFHVGRKLSTVYGGGPAIAFNRIYGYMDFKWDEDCHGCRPKWCIDNNQNSGTIPGTEISCEPKGGYTGGAHTITFATLFLTDDGKNYHNNATHEKLRNNVVHELGHAFNNRLGKLPENLLFSTQREAWSDCYIAGFPDREDLEDGQPTGPYYGFASQQGVLMWQMNSSGSPSEEFADMFLGWTFDEWEPVSSSNDGKMRADWMSKYMPYFIWLALWQN